jgi:DNA mismatch repair protein MutS
VALSNGDTAPFEECLAGLRLVAPKNVAGWRAALRDELPQNRRDGGFVRPGYCAELDAAASLRDDTRRVVAALQATYAEATGIRGLKIKHNNMLGYFVEMNARDGERLAARPIPESALIRERSHDLPGSNPPEGGFIPAPDPKPVPAFIHRQTMANAMRFSTAELADLERRIAEAADTALAREQAIFDELCEKILAEAEPIRAAAQALAILDVSAALAELAADCNYVRPTVDASLAFAIETGRHPVVEQSLRRDGKTFVGNDSDLGPASAALPPSPLWGGAGGGDFAAAQPSDPGRIYLLTGPNMAGKSTFLRQNALIAILAQAGSFVPAKAAHIGIVDALFSRVGAADDLARGRSTFMVEMVETAAILNQAGPRALVILDEIGRGTATFDGLSIAWAVIEHLHAENCCRALFATHYHELTALSARLPRLVNVTMSVKEWKGDVVFLHEVLPGAADHSYGIHVAKLAGLPAPVISRARAVLALLEKGERARPVAIVDDLPLFAAAPPERGGAGGGAAPPDPVAEALAAIDPDHLTPKEALDALYRLKALSSGGDS